MAKKVCLVYAQEDTRDRRMIEKFKGHLTLPMSNNCITLWDEGDIKPGQSVASEAKERLEEADIILLGISSAFLQAHYIDRVVIQEAIKRGEQQKICVIPLILRPVTWQMSPLDKLQPPLPVGGKPIARHRTHDIGYTNAATELLKIVQQADTKRSLAFQVDTKHSLELQERRKIVSTDFERLAEAVEVNLQPQPRAVATAGTLRQLSILIPREATLADLRVGWQIVARPRGEEAPNIVQRRITCGQLAELASQITTGQGDLEQAIQTWKAWSRAFMHSDDPRRMAMGVTFTRELAELQEAK